MSKPQYHFQCQITDATTGEVVECDWCSLPDTDPVGHCELVINAQVAQMLENWRKFARAEYESANYQVAL